MNHYKLNVKFAIGLWLLHGAVVTLASVSEVTDLAAVAQDKSVVWLSLVTAITAIGFSAWLVRQMLAQQMAAVEAINRLREELAKRPCILKNDKP